MKKVYTTPAIQILVFKPSDILLWDIDNPSEREEPCPARRYAGWDSPSGL